MKRIILIVVLLAIYIGGLLYKNKLQIASKGEAPATISQIRGEKGIPVESKTVAKGRFVSEIKVSGFINSKGLLKSELTRNTINRLNRSDTPALEANGKKYQGRITNISDRPNIYTGLFDVVIQFSNVPKEAHGRISVVSIPTRVLENVVILERSAVSFREKKPFAYVINEESKIEKKELVVGESNDELIIIKSGVVPGDLVVISDQRYLEENDFVFNASKEEK